MRIYHASLSLRVLKKYYRTVLGTSQRPHLGCFNRKRYRRVLEQSAYDQQHHRGLWGLVSGQRKATRFFNSEAHFLFEAVAALFHRYFNFDIDFSDQGFSKNWANQQKMEAAGLSPIPVVHNFFNFEIAFYMSLEKYPWLALGSAQSKNFDDFRYAVDQNQMEGFPGEGPLVWGEQV